MDISLLAIWWGLPLAILLGRAGLAAYRTKKKRQELRELEKTTTPFTRKL
ncbi:MAG: hypothetical protein GQ580_03400 [Candidatus Thorarchaeota archaeon]|nr:hypothetical protein [Candidatus Thorarchaeota archaeon]